MRERRLGLDRRSGIDRRNGTDRRSYKTSGYYTPQRMLHDRRKNDRREAERRFEISPDSV